MWKVRAMYQNPTEAASSWMNGPVLSTAIANHQLLRRLSLSSLALPDVRIPPRPVYPWKERRDDMDTIEEY